MSGQTLLSSLCSVCNINESKYKCPGCSARTCSLPCVKRHKQWAQCSGKRDPTKYVKKSELATPAGIDHDYNFLSGIERSLESSEKSVTEKGLDAGLNARPKGNQAQGMDYHLAAAGVKVIRAPKGMSRSKENKTYRSKSGNRNIIWTIEWIGADNTRTLTQGLSIEPVYRLHPLHESPYSKKKRKREADAQNSADTSAQKCTIGSQGPETTSAPIETTAERARSLNLTSTPWATGDSIESTKPYPAQVDTTGPSERFNFYLHRPRTSSSRRVLIPLDSSSTLGDSLRGRTVEEFPTIYYFPMTTTIAEPPEGFILDEDYRREEGEQQREFEELMREVDPEILKRLKEDGPHSKDDEEVDSKKILDVLKQDLGGL